jgi:hypothetical protein
MASPLWPVLQPLVDDLTVRSGADTPASENQEEDLQQVLDRTLGELLDAEHPPR